MKYRLIDLARATEMLDAWCARFDGEEAIAPEWGRFLFYDKDKWIGIDNSTGDFWMEEFRRLKDAIGWLEQYA